MPDRLSKWIVKTRWVLVGIFILAAAVSAFMIDDAQINYDFTDYLSEDTVTYQSLRMMEAEFGNTDQLTIMFEDLPEGECARLAQELNEREGILRATYNPEQDQKTIDGVKYERIETFLECEDSIEYVSGLQKEFESRSDIGVFYLSGPAPQTLKLKESIMREVVVAMIIAVCVVLAVLLLTSHSWFDPVIFVIVLMVSIVINMGTNWVFDSISFVTFAVAAILQLALAMDYSIMLLHSYFEMRALTDDRVRAMEMALSKSFMPVSSSALTTIAGLVSLMFMSFTIGFDLGVVLSKGIVISMLTVFLLMPALILAFSKPLEIFRHRPLPLGGRAIGRFAYRMRRVLPVFLIVLIVFSACMQNRNEYVFTDNSFNIESNKVSQVFGLSNQLVLLFPTDMSDEGLDRQRELIETLKGVTFHGKNAVTSVTALVTTGEMAVKYYTLEEISELSGIPPLALGMYTGSMGFGTVVRGDELVDKAAELMTENDMIQSIKDTLDFARSMFVGEKYSRMILLMDIPYFGEDMYRTLDEISDILLSAYPDSKVGIAGATMSSYDIASAFGSDMMLVNLITIAFVVIIILLSFRNACIPLILVCVIQGAIWLTLSVSTLLGEGIFFMCYLIITAIMMGATIDYGILLTQNYRQMRKTLPEKAAIGEALELSAPTIFTSGIILCVSGFIIGSVCSVYYISNIGQILARGAAISVVLVLTLLPMLLVNADRLIIGKKGYREEKENG